MPSAKLFAAVASSRRNIPWPALAVACAVVVVYARTLGYGLVWDDQDLIRQAQEGGFSRLFTAPFLRTEYGYWRPMVLLSLWLDSRLAGAFPGVYHLTNILLHALVSLLVYRLLVLLFADRRAACLGALLFAVHPVHVESVAFVSGRTDLWAGLFVLGATTLWARERCGAVRRPWLLRGSACLCAFLGALSKETAFMLPVLIAAADLLLPARVDEPPAARRRRLLLWLALTAGAQAAALALRFGLAGVMVGATGVVPGAGYGPALLRVPVKMTAVGLTYLRLLVIPWPLNAYYTAGQIHLSLATLLGAACLLALCLAPVRGGDARTGLLALAWTAVFLLPVSGIAQLSAASMAERFLYLPSVGLSLAAARLMRRSPSNRLPAAAGATVALGAVLIFGTLCVAREGVWRDEITLFSDLTRTSPGVWLHHLNLGKAYLSQGRYEDAERTLQQAVKLGPVVVTAWVRLGDALSHLDRWGEAVTAYARAVELDPTDTSARHNLAIAAVTAGDLTLARREYDVLRGRAPDLAARIRDLLPPEYR